MLSFATTLALLAMPLLVSAAAAVPTTDAHPPTKRPPALARRPKPALPTPTLATAQQTAAPAPAPVAVASASGLPAAPAAPQTVQLTGIVLAPDGRPCAGASVYPAGAPRQLVVTDAKGTFALPVPAGSPISIRVEYFGEGSSRVEVPAPGTGPLRITLGQ